MRKMGTVVILLTAFALSATEIFVAPNGNDAWSGRLAVPDAGRMDGPLATLTRALAVMRKMPIKSAPAAKRIVVRGGVYRITSPILLTPQDSGSASCPLVIEAFEGEKPIFSGGRKIRGWRTLPDGLWETDVPEARNGSWTFNQLFVKRRLIHQRSHSCNLHSHLCAALYKGVANVIVNSNVGEP